MPRPITTNRWSLLIGLLVLMGSAACGGGGTGGANTYAIGGSVSGLGAGKTLVLDDNGGDALTVGANGAFRFLTRLAAGAPYAVTVATQPSGQTCNVTAGTGTATADVTDVGVACADNPPQTYTVGGMVSGLGAGASLVLQDNGGDDLTVAANGPFTFATALTAGSAYSVTVRTQPAGQTCSVAQASGTASANVTSVAVSCVASGGQTYAVGGTVSGLAAGHSVVLQDNGTDNLTVATNGSFTFATRLASGAAYRVTVLTQPAGQTCSVAGGSGTVATASVTSVQVTCGAASYTISGIISPAASGAGVAVTLGGAASATTFTDGSGHYAFAGLANGAYTVAPAAPDTTFAPASAAITVAGADVTTANFTSTAKVVFFDDFAGSALSSAWTVISRHGEYAQSETECNIPQQVAVANGLLTITTAATPYTCGDFNLDGTVRHAPAQWPYVTGDVQWKSLNFTYGTVTVRAKFPAQSTGLWPAIWLLDAECQATNPVTADTNYGGCPDLYTSNYVEIDITECDLTNWCQLALANFGNNGSGGSSFPVCGYPVDTQYHVFTMVWTANLITVSVDGQPTGCSYASPMWTIPAKPQFLILQTQTGGAGGTPNDAELPASFQIDYVKVTQP